MSISLPEGVKKVWPASMTTNAPWQRTRGIVAEVRRLRRGELEIASDTLGFSRAQR
jgi:hypothetical protein